MGSILGLLEFIYVTLPIVIAITINKQKVLHQYLKYIYLYLFNNDTDGNFFQE